VLDVYSFMPLTTVYDVTPRVLVSMISVPVGTWITAPIMTLLYDGLLLQTLCVKFPGESISFSTQICKY